MESFLANIQFQIAAILVLFTVSINYFGAKRINLLSTRCFSMMLIFACFNLIFDFGTVYTITHMDTVPAWANRLCHQLFIGTLDTMVYLMYLYVAFLGRSQRRLCVVEAIFNTLPYAGSIAFVVLGDLYYHCEGDSVYSYGPMAIALYVNVAIYLLLANWLMIRHRHTYTKKMRHAIHFGTLLWALVAMLQFNLKDYLISGIGVALMMLHLYISFENPSENYDSLAHSFNRRSFYFTLSEIIGRKKTFFVMNFVLDGMNVINKKFGFTSANNLLCEVSDAISGLTHADVCHYRGNALAVILKSKKEAERVSERLVAKMGKPWTEQSIMLTGKYHIDVLECPRYAQTVDGVCETLDYMYEAPHSSSAICFVDDSDIKLKHRHDAIETLLEQALAEDGFTVVYQPIYSAEDKRFSSAEALVRLKNTGSVGFISPEEFIPMAERRGCIGQLGEVVFSKVCKFAARERLWERGINYIEVNLSGLQAADHTVAASYEAIMREYRVPATFLNFEITETAAVEAGEAMQANIAKFTDLGCSFSIDDFGTGYSNLAQLCQMTYDLVKIDKSLIWPVFEVENERAKVVLESVIIMADRLGKELVAEGVETEEQANRLMEMGVGHLQGYFYSRPVSEEEFLRLITQEALDK